jgi:ATP-binding cassette subfamily B protein
MVEENKTKQFKEYALLMLKFFKGYEKHFVLMIIFFVIKQSPQYLQPILIGKLIDTVTIPEGQRLMYLVFYGFIMIIFTAQNPFTHPIYIKFQSIISRGISQKFRVEICRKLQQMSLLKHNRTSSGRMFSKIIRDIDVIEGIPRMIPETIIHAVVSIVIVVVVTLTRAPMVLSLLLIIVPIATLINRGFRGMVKSRAKDFRLRIEDMSAKLSDMITMMPITRAHGLEGQELETIKDRIERVYVSGLKFDVLSARFVAISWTSFTLCQIAFLLITVYLSFKGVTTPGDIVIFNSFFSSLSGTVMVFLGLMPMLTQVGESLKSVNEVLNEQELEYNENKTEINEPIKTIEFKNVTYYYPGTDTPAVDGLSFVVNNSESVAFVGQSGCGKTTALFLILGFLRPTTGEILINGHNVNDLDMRSFRKQVGVVTQDSVFFSGTIRDNVAYGETAVNDDEINKALKLANLHDFVRSLKNGLDTKYGEEGTNFSGGQKQRIAIARALYREPQVLVLDEATSSLDVESEMFVQKALDQVMHNQTTFIVSHRLSIVRNVDRIYVMVKGKIDCSGKHDELLKYDNAYSTFFKHYIG